MSTFPTVTVPSSVSPFTYTEYTQIHEYDKGYKSTRSRYSKPLRKWSFDYFGLNYNDAARLIDFIETVRGSGELFTVTMPHGPRIANATAASPITITTEYYNNFLTGDTVTTSGINGMTGANITALITVLTSKTFTLTGSTGTGTFSGTAASVAVLVFPKVQLLIDDGVFRGIEKILGPDYNEYGIRSLRFDFMEQY